MIIYRVIDNGIPCGTTTAIGYPSPVVTPGFVGQLGKDGIRGGAVGLLLGIGHGVKAPYQLATLHVVGRHITPDTQLASCVTNDHHVFENTRRPGNGVGLGLIHGDLTPDHLTGCGIQRLKTAVKDTNKHFAVMHCHTAVDDVAAPFGSVFAGHFGVINPQLLAGLGVQGIHHRPRARYIHHPVNDKRCGLGTARLGGLIYPAHTQLGERVAVDLSQRRVALLVIGTAVGQPHFRLFGCRGNAIRINLRNRHGL